MIGWNDNKASLGFRAKKFAVRSERERAVR